MAAVDDNDKRMMCAWVSFQMERRVGPVGAEQRASHPTATACNRCLLKEI